jgi:hypothetical protein
LNIVSLQKVKGVRVGTLYVFRRWLKAVRPLQAGKVNGCRTSTGGTGFKQFCHQVDKEFFVIMVSNLKAATFKTYPSCERYMFVDDCDML